jgi:hypothetical protein
LIVLDYEDTCVFKLPKDYAAFFRRLGTWALGRAHV